MTQPQRPIPVAADPDDTEGQMHRLKGGGADAERAEGDNHDTEGHRGRLTDAERAEGDNADTEGHGIKWP